MKVRAVKEVVPAELLSKPSARTVGDIVDAYQRTVAVKVFTMDHLKAAARRW